MQFVARHARSRLMGVVCLLVVSPAVAQQPAEQSVPFQSPACRERTRQFDLVAEPGSLEINTALFSAADAGCEPLARRLLDAGASLAARDRLGAMPLAHAARAGHLPLVALF